MKAFEQTKTFELGGVRITVVERTEIEHHHGETGFVVTARKSPDTVLIEDEAGSPRSIAISR